jgi:hypothetical protein
LPLDKPFDGLTKTDIEELISNKVPEGKTIEYKLALPGPGGDDKKEFLADVSSFSNTVGGHLIYGVQESNALPVDVLGVDGGADTSIQRLENLLRDGIQPRLPGVQIRTIPVTDSRVAIVLRIPKSWALPHRVIFGGHDKFYGRNATGKYPLDVPELRALFALSESTAERIRAFRAERIMKIVADDGAVSLGSGPKTILHLVPFAAFAPGVSFNVSLFPDITALLPPIGPGSNVTHRLNFDGIVTYSFRDEKTRGPYSYVQLFRSGAIEAVEGRRIKDYDGDKLIPGTSWEDEILKALSPYVGFVSTLGVQPPIAIMLSLIGVQGYSMHTGFGLDKGNPIDRDILLVSDLLVETFDGFDPGKVMRPAFDAVWNAAGLSQSLSYDKDGQWRKAGDQIRRK